MSSQPADDNWQPIETAPKDGSGIILGRGSINGLPGLAGEGYWCDHSERWMLANTHWTDHFDSAINPSHWQPLPNPPGVSDE